MHIFNTRRYKSSKKWGYYKLDRDLNGRVIVLTGASEGLGFEVTNEYTFDLIKMFYPQY